MATDDPIEADSPITPNPTASRADTTPVPEPVEGSTEPEPWPGLIPGQPTPPAHTPARVVICWGEGAGGSRAFGWVTEAHTVEVTPSGPLLELRATDIGEGASYRLTLYPPGVEVPAGVIAAGRPYALAAHDQRLS